jgi:hypothetical protein
MKKLIHLAIPITVLFITLFLANAEANQCSTAVIKAMEDEGLSESQIKSICSKAETYAQKKDTVFTPEKIKQDLIGKSVGPDTFVKVKNNSRGDSGKGTDSSYDVFATVPTGIMFDMTNIRSINVLDTKITGDKAQVVIHVDTVSMYAGRLRLYYELIAREWTLLEIENLDFKHQ